MDKKIFKPEKYGMVICPCCNGQGYIQNPNNSVVQNAEALDLLEKKRRKTQMLLAIVINCQGEQKD